MMERNMSNRTWSKAKLTTAASFPENYFLENLAVRADNSGLITALTHKQLRYVPTHATKSTKPVLLYTFDQLTLSLTEVESDVFYLCTSNVYTDHKSSLHRIDLRNWSAGNRIQPQKVLDFPGRAGGLNGSCLIGRRTILVADSMAGLIWRVDLPNDGATPVARVWLQHESMGYYPGQMKPEQPGINGIQYAPKLGYIYYTATAKKLFMRVQVNPATLDATGEPEHVSTGRMADDFCIDEDAGVAYVTTHRENTIDCISLDPAKNSERHVVAGDPFTEELIEPSSGAWSRLSGERGKVAYFISDGGTASPPPDGLRRPTKLLRGAPTAARGHTVSALGRVARCRFEEEANWSKMTVITASFRLSSASRVKKRR
jgi:sugar lactone lactonase YvrE